MCVLRLSKRVRMSIASITYHSTNQQRTRMIHSTSTYNVSGSCTYLNHIRFRKLSVCVCVFVRSFYVANTYTVCCFDDDTS